VSEVKMGEQLGDGVVAIFFWDAVPPIAVHFVRNLHAANVQSVNKVLREDQLSVLMPIYLKACDPLISGSVFAKLLKSENSRILSSWLRWIRSSYFSDSVVFANFT
jgi:hypothetical protein